MTEDNRLEMENKALRERLARLTEASLRVSESLDLDTVLSEVVGNARKLTAARYGAITLIDESKQFLALVTSGLTMEERESLVNSPDGLRFFEFLRDYPEPIRLIDLNMHAKSMGVNKGLVSLTSFLGAPILHRGVQIGNFYLANKECSREFTDEDQETLVAFAVQAAAGIANARRHRDEQRARADLETLVETFPVGVIVFEARSGKLVSLNREARRIAKVMQGPEGSVDQVLEVVLFRRGGERETSLKELSLPYLLSLGETIRAEEIVMRVPDGGSVSVLMNSTPIRNEEGEVESVVVTMQDLTPLQEMERLRAEFLAMVSHELRTPLTSVKGSVITLLDSAATLNPTEVRQFLRIIDSQTDKMRALISDLLDVARIETGSLSVTPEPTDLALLVNDATTAFVSFGNKHAIKVDLEPNLPWVMADRPRMIQVFYNLIMNASRHSPESTPIEISATLDELHVVISVSDHGRGIPAESLPHLFLKFSQVETNDQGGNSGLGLAICKGIVEAHGGRIWAESDGPGLGARFTFTVPTIEDSGYVSPVTHSLGIKRADKGPQMRILAVDDDPQTLRYVRETLTNAGFLAAGAANAEEALSFIGAERPDLVLLDVMLPGTNGIDLMKEIRELHDAPVIFLSAYGQDELVARAFDAGAADYVVKPFSATELNARIRAALRRQIAEEPLDPYVLGDLRIDYSERRVTVEGEEVRLTAIEYRTLAELAVNAGKVLTHTQLLRRIWGEDRDGDVRPMRTVMSTLRHRLKDDFSNPKYIFTEPRIGYRMAKGEDAR